VILGQRELEREGSNKGNQCSFASAIHNSSDSDYRKGIPGSGNRAINVVLGSVPSNERPLAVIQQQTEYRSNNIREENSKELVTIS